MPDWFRQLCLRLLRIPGEPEAPAGSSDSIQIFRAAPNYFRLRVVYWALQQLVVVIIVGVTIVLPIFDGGELRMPELNLSDENFGRGLIELLAWAGLCFWLAQLPFSFALVRLDYELRWYIVTDRSLRIRHGVWRVEEKTMSFANVQEVSVKQGPLQRLLGIYSLMVRSAGGGAMTAEQGGENPLMDLHIGVFQGIDNAEEVRDLILNRLKAFKDAGLGDPDDEPASVVTEDVTPIGPVEAAKEMLAEVRLLSGVVRQRQDAFLSPAGDASSSSLEQ